MKNPALQAHRGVSTEFPENTMIAFKAAKLQGYEIIELDPAVTSDGVFVIHHDKALGRTSRNPDGTELAEKPNISDVTYADIKELDYGVWFSAKFKGEHIPTMEEVLVFAEENKIPLKIDNKIMRFSEENIENFFALVKKHNASVGFTSNTVDFVRRVCDNFDNCDIHYDGEITEDILKEIRAICGERKLVVWIPMSNKRTTWVKVPFLSKELADTVKKYAELGVWILSDYAQLDEAAELGADYVETTGSLKPGEYCGFKADTHVHTNHSHDSKCAMSELVAVAAAKGLNSVNVTDHSDTMTDPNVYKYISESVAEANGFDTLNYPGFKIRSGVEIGEPYANAEMTDRILSISGCDSVLGSVHSVRGSVRDREYFSGIDFSDMPEADIYTYLDDYFTDVLELLNFLPCDILAHLTCPIRYINGKYGRNISIERYMPKIEEILKFIISHGVALEINTSGIGGALDDFMPSEHIIRLYRELGGYMLTFASDAHAADNVANGFDCLTSLLKTIGFRDAFYFEARMPMPYKI